MIQQQNAYKNQGVSFEKIFNDDHVKYDKHGQFYTFKYQRNNIQIRILYAYITVDETEIIMITDYFVKKKNDKSYIKQFDKANNLNPKDIYYEFKKNEKQKSR